MRSCGGGSLCTCKKSDSYWTFCTCSSLETPSILDFSVKNFYSVDCMPPMSRNGADGCSVLVVYAQACRSKDAGLISTVGTYCGTFFNFSPVIKLLPWFRTKPELISVIRHQESSAQRGIRTTCKLVASLCSCQLIVTAVTECCNLPNHR